MARRWPVNKLIEASEHLFYEIWMLYQSSAHLVKLGVQGTPIANAFVESFGMHARVVLSVFYDEKPRPDDVIAGDFFNTSSEWRKICPPLANSLSNIDFRIGKEMAHLTYERLNVAPDAKPWPHFRMARDIDNIVKVFQGAVPKDRVVEKLLLLDYGHEFKLTTGHDIKDLSKREFPTL